VDAQAHVSRTRRALIVTAALLAGAAAIGVRAGTIDPPESLMVQSFAAPIAIPAFTLRDVEGRELTSTSFHGKVVLLNFWATWCVPCRAEMPALEKLYREHRNGGFVALAVNFKEKARDVQRFTRDLGLTLPMALDADGTVSRDLKVRGLPVTFLLDRDGRILWRAIGARDWDGPDGRAYFERFLTTPRS